jgi:hypothetical protein
MFWAFGLGFTTQPPVCESCAWKVRGQRLGGLALMLLTALLVMLFLWPRLDDLAIPQLGK